MKQNKYDEPDFFIKYSEMPRSVGGLENAGEWPAFRQLLPDLRDQRLLDLGCGFGWHCRYAREQGARFVIGVDLSEKMLARAKTDTRDSAIEYRRCAIEDIDFADGQFDVVMSSLALHYVEPFNVVCLRISRWLTTGGTFVFSVEHPVFTAIAAQEWCSDSRGERLHWPVDDYQQEGPRNAKWIGDNVIKYHRTTATYVNTVVDSGLSIAKLIEPKPTTEMLVKWPEWKDECRRPMFLLIAAFKPIPTIPRS